MPHCNCVPLPTLLKHCRHWHQTERFGEYNIRVATICYPRPLQGLSHGAMFDSSRGCDRVAFADSLVEVESSV